jgi:glycerol-3-phosphate dehydrogenase (NAD(P)+)
MTIDHAGIVGAGGWGTALAILLGSKGIPVKLWGNEPDLIAEFAQTRENRPFLPGVRIPDCVEPTDDLAATADAPLILVVTPSKAIRSVAARLAAAKPRPGSPILSCTKGIEFETGLRMTQLLAETLPDHPVAALSGPSHAEEVSRGAPTAVVLASAEPAVAEELQSLFSTGTFRPYTSPDVAGVELGGALKNIFAIAAGICDGLGLGDNSKAALVTRSLAELIRLGVALGGKRETFQGLSGVGDLMVTCFSRHSRNRGLGERLGRGESLEAATASSRMVAEGVPTTRSAERLARSLGIDTPIIDTMRDVLFEKLPPHDALLQLLARHPRAEEE